MKKVTIIAGWCKESCYHQAVGNGKYVCYRCGHCLVFKL